MALVIATATQKRIDACFARHWALLSAITRLKISEHVTWGWKRSAERAMEGRLKSIPVRQLIRCPLLFRREALAWPAGAGRFLAI